MQRGQEPFGDLQFWIFTRIGVISRKASSRQKRPCQAYFLRIKRRLETVLKHIRNKKHITGNKNQESLLTAGVISRTAE